MASLYQIDRAILECCDLETGEVIDTDRLAELQIERNQKIENIALWIKNLESDALAYKAEKDAFAEREKKAAAKAEQLKVWLAEILVGETFSTAKCAISFRRSYPLEIDDDVVLPERFYSQTVTKKPNKEAIKHALNCGQKVSGCRIVEKLNTQIK